VLFRSSAARFYGAALGYEPGGFGSARGVAARLYNALTNGGVHLFYYHSNLYANDQAIDTWLAHAPLLDRRARPVNEIAAFYPDTAIKLDDEVVRHLWASAFLSRAEAMRSSCDFDFVSEQMIDDGALPRHKVLLFLWGHVTEKRILDRIAKWVDDGGVLIYPERPRGPLETVEGDLTVWQRWRRGETGKGRVIFFPGDPEPGEPYARFVRDELRKLPHLDARLRRALAAEKPRDVYWSVLENGITAWLNFSDDAAEVRPAKGGPALRMNPYTIALE
jgi:putative NIF3 family GTP cyclohydrolase 1 type 2